MQKTIDIKGKIFLVMLLGLLSLLARSSLSYPQVVTRAGSGCHHQSQPECLVCWLQGSFLVQRWLPYHSFIIFLKSNIFSPLLFIFYCLIYNISYYLKLFCRILIFIVKKQNNYVIYNYFAFL